MKLVRQDGEQDCGPASVATLCGKTLEETTYFIHKLMGRKGKTSSGYLIKAIEHFGRQVVGKKCTAIGRRKLFELENDALLGCFVLVPASDERFAEDTQRKVYGYKHWAVWDCRRKTILDPYRHERPLLVDKLIEVVK